MRIEQLSPTVTEWKNGKTMIASSWRSVDDIDSLGDRRRRVWHYDTLMMEFVFVFEEDEDGNCIRRWHSFPMSIGHGSVTDQKYMNILFATTKSSLRMKRDAKGGGARIVNTLHGNLVAVADGSDRWAWKASA